MSLNAGIATGVDKLSKQALTHFLLSADVEAMLPLAASLRDRRHGDLISYSRKVFIPLTTLCRDICGYCTFATRPDSSRPAYLSLDQVLDIARKGEVAGCHEVLFTLGDKPERRYGAARQALADFGVGTTIDYLVQACETLLAETGLVPHINAGLMGRDDMLRLREVSASQGIMLESTSRRLLVKGSAHYGCPDKEPEKRLAMIDLAGELNIPFTTGILIGIGETREERLDALFAIKELHERHGHIQEVIIQNFRAKPGTAMAQWPEPSFDDFKWTIAAARLIMGAEMNIQAPPNLSYERFPELVEAGINDWGGVSPVTPDHVNPEAVWPHIRILEAQSAAQGKVLVPRLASYPAYLYRVRDWHAPAIATRLLRLSDSQGYARTDSWLVGGLNQPPKHQKKPELPPYVVASSAAAQAVKKASSGQRLSSQEVVELLSARGVQAEYVWSAADDLRAEVSGDQVRYVVNRNINYTNVCTYRCRFCAFSKAGKSDSLRGPAYDIPLDELARRAREAWERGATEVCLQGGIHPDYSGQTYLNILDAVRSAVPKMHIHAFSPLEVRQGADTLGISIDDFLAELKVRGLASLPGTAAEVLDDEVRKQLCPDKLLAGEWLDIVSKAHCQGLRTTSTLMFGHIEHPIHLANHLLSLRDLQSQTGGFTEFVALPFVSSEAPMYLRGQARMGPTYAEAVGIHAVARLVFNPLITNIQASWVKLGDEGVKAALASGANDLGGTLMNESISRAAGTRHGQEKLPAEMDALILAAGRRPAQRSTFYGEPPGEQVARSYQASPLEALEFYPAGKLAATGSARLRAQS